MPLEVALKVKVVFRALQIDNEFVFRRFGSVQLFFFRAVKPDVVVDCHEQKVEEKLFDA